MIRVYIKDDKIVKTVAYGFYTKEAIPDNDYYVDSEFNITDKIKFENGVILIDTQIDSSEKRIPKNI